LTDIGIKKTHVKYKTYTLEDKGIIATDNLNSNTCSHRRDMYLNNFSMYLNNT